MNVPDRDNTALEYLLALNEAQRQLDWGTDVDAMESAAAALRRWDAKHQLLGALETRIRRVVRVRLLFAKAKLASQLAAAASEHK